MDKKIKKNYILNLTYEIFALIVPIFVMPYVSRVLTVNGVGIYSYTYSIVYYFMLLGALGFGTYGRRVIAQKKDNEEEKINVFWELTFLKLISSIVSCILFIATSIIFYRGTDFFIYLISISFYLLGVALDITFYFQGNENFSSIIFKNIFIKIIGVILIFVFVKTKEDLFIYILLQALIYVVSSASLWLGLNRRVFHFKFKDLRFKRHLVPSFKLFIPTIATSIYMMLDKTLIGTFITETYVEIETQVINGVETQVEVIKKVSEIENGVYEQSEKIIKMVVTILTSLSTIVSPRNSYYYEKGEIQKVKEKVTSSCLFSLMIAIPLVLGIILIAKDFAPLYFGKGYEKTSYLMMILSPLILFIGLSTVFGMQYLIASGKDTKYIVAVLIGAIVNVIFNIILIPILYSYGAAIATVIAEFIICILMIIFSKEIVEKKKLFIYFLKYLLLGGCMFTILFFVNSVIPNDIIRIAVDCIGGVLIYFIPLFISKDKVLYDFVWSKRRKKNGLE